MAGFRRAKAVGDRIDNMNPGCPGRLRGLKHHEIYRPDSVDHLRRWELSQEAVIALDREQWLDERGLLAPDAGGHRYATGCEHSGVLCHTSFSGNADRLPALAELVAPEPAVLALGAAEARVDRDPLGDRMPGDVPADGNDGASGLVARHDAKRGRELALQKVAVGPALAASGHTDRDISHPHGRVTDRHNGDLPEVGGNGRPHRGRFTTPLGANGLTDRGATTTSRPVPT